MSTKYNCRFCSCGRIHIMPAEYMSWLSEDPEKRSIIHVCQNCGATVKIFLDEYMDGYAVNCVDYSNVDLSSEELANTKLLMNEGIKVPVKDGLYATCHNSVTWWDEENGKGGPYSVDTERLIKEVNDEDILNSISKYVVGIDWTGTPYEKFTLRCRC